MNKASVYGSEVIRLPDNRAEKLDLEITKQFEAIEKVRKTTFEFEVDADYKDRFLQLIGHLSVPELGVDVGPKDVRIRVSGHLKTFVRVKVSGAPLDVKRWKDNIDHVLTFLRGKNCLEYNKTV